MQSTSEDAENGCDRAIYDVMDWADGIAGRVAGDWSPSQVLQAAQLVHARAIQTHLETLTAALEKLMPMVDNPAMRFLAGRKKG